MKEEPSAGVGEKTLSAIAPRAISAAVRVRSCRIMSIGRTSICLRQFVPERGKIMPSRISGISAKDQRRIAKAIKRARSMAMLPFVVAEL